MFAVTVRQHISVVFEHVCAVQGLPVSSPAPAAPAPLADIRIELHRGATAVTVTWPACAASECATWLRELLR